MGRTDEERVANGLRQRLIALAAKSGDAAEPSAGATTMPRPPYPPNKADVRQ